MRTTIEIPDLLMKRAKQLALNRGTTLKCVVVDALEREVVEGEVVAGRRVSFPLVRSAQPGSLQLSNADIEAFEADDDAW